MSTKSPEFIALVARAVEALDEVARSVHCGPGVRGLEADLLLVTGLELKDLDEHWCAKQQDRRMQDEPR